jgi:hypothetical protein
MCSERVSIHFTGLARLAGCPGAEHLLPGDLELRAEPAPDLRGDDADLLLVDAEDERHEEADEVRHLGRGVDV